MHHSDFYPKFLDILHLSIGVSNSLQQPITHPEWKRIFRIADEQGIVGILYMGLEKLAKGQGPQLPLLLQWTGMAQDIRNRNAQLYRLSAQLTDRFANANLPSCILKGQGLALLYPSPYVRTPGDIDIWVDGGRKIVMDYVNKFCPGQVMRYHHVDFPVFKDVPVEVHFFPSYMKSPLANRKLQTWFQLSAHEQFSNSMSLPDDLGFINAPTLNFNLVFILSHLYRHLFSEGIGIRQLLDYYYLLLHTDDQQSRVEAARHIDSLGMRRFARAVMYIMTELFCLPASHLLFPPDPREGQYLLHEVLIGGNFGQYDTRLGNKHQESVSHRWLRMTIRNMRFILHYPSESLCEPVFRTWFWMQKIIHGIS